MKFGDTDLEFGGFQGDRDTYEDDSSESNGSVTLPMLGPTVGPTTHTPDLSPEISTMRMVSSAGHFPYTADEKLWRVVGSTEQKIKINWRCRTRFE